MIVGALVVLQYLLFKIMKKKPFAGRFMEQKVQASHSAPCL